jgi:hypothetical protein
MAINPCPMDEEQWMKSPTNITWETTEKMHSMLGI